MCLITFLIPIYNEIRTVENAIKEVVNLDYPKKQIIIIDNNSNDGTKKIIKKFKDLDEVTIILKDKNLGFGDSIKKGLELSKGEYIYIQYADLEYNIKGFSLMFDKIVQAKTDFIFGERYKKKNLKDIIFSIKDRPAFIGTLITTKLINIFYKKKFNDIIGAKLYKTSKIKEINVSANGAGFDFELISKMCKKQYNIETVIIPYKPRTHSKEKKIKFYHMFNAIYEILKVKFFN
jgi:glycosyltransferase involved in cell wall biosynthesis